ncbi:MAG: 1-deoxy-D-xylulose-5-phosphate synthase [candidate division WOR-3 bacterium]|nr:1-deoxy-D-xylulose-5-phosphate synthase [candidate division WOR-3 bacterium]
MALLEKINKPDDLKKYSVEQLQVLAREIREEILKTVSRNGGHLAPSLGVVELTLALYRVFDAEKDKIIWDVGHQTYAQKLITGRRDKFPTLRTYKGISGFPKREESRYDSFNTGHSSTSLSAAAGFAIARDFRGEKYHIISVIGDGSLGAGMAFEALNYIGQLKKDVIVILNDNERSIGETVGALSQYLNRIITTRTYNRFRDDLWVFLGRFPPYIRDRARNLAKRIQEGLKGLYSPSVIFEELGFRYIGPLNGHRLNELIDTFSRVKEMHGPRLVHVVTKKGKGYKIAEDSPEKFHGIGPFDLETGEELYKYNSYTKVFGDALVKFAEKNKKIVALTAGMCLGTGLKEFSLKFPERFFDVGICEQHAVTMAAALALEGYIPVCAIYSTFLQRAYDQIIHDVCLQNAPVIFAIDRAGLVGEDGPTHHGPFDLSYLNCIPNIIISAPKDGDELVSLLKTAIEYRNGPFAIRYPRGICDPPRSFHTDTLEIGKWEILNHGKDIAVISCGSMVKPSLEILSLLKKENINPYVINARFVKPIDFTLLDAIVSDLKSIFVIEENTFIGGLGSTLATYLTSKNHAIKVKIIALPDRFIPHGPRDTILGEVGLDTRGIADKIIGSL